MSIALQNLEVKGALEWNTPLFIIAVGGTILKRTWPETNPRKTVTESF